MKRWWGFGQENIVQRTAKRPRREAVRVGLEGVHKVLDGIMQETAEDSKSNLQLSKGAGRELRHGAVVRFTNCRVFRPSDESLVWDDVWI